MNLVCVICTDSFKGSDEVQVTKCGHMFHNMCLMQWFERSQSCPQCRAKCSMRTVNRVFFNVATTDPTAVDVDSLHQEIDTLSLKVRQSEKELKELREENEVERLCASQANKSIKLLNKEVSSYKVTHATMKVQLDMARSRLENQEQLHNKIAELEAKQEQMDMVNRLMKCTSLEADKLLKNTDAKTLSMMVSSLKHELEASEQNRAELRRRIHTVQNEIKSTRDQERKHLERISELDSENYSLKTQVEQLQKELETEASGNAAKEIPMAVTRLSPPINPRKRKLLASDIIQTPTGIRENPVSGESPNSPYLNIASSMIGLTPLLKPNSGTTSLARELQKTSENKFSIFKKSRLTEKTTTSTKHLNFISNGLGGSEKAEVFPSPLRERPNLPGLNSKASRLKGNRLASSSKGFILKK